MHRLELLPAGAGPARLLALGAHCDDIEIGCGGTMLRLDLHMATYHTQTVTITKVVNGYVWLNLLFGPLGIIRARGVRKRGTRRPWVWLLSWADGEGSVRCVNRCITVAGGQRFSRAVAALAPVAGRSAPASRRERGSESGRG